MITHESYISLETAKLLKTAGFDWEVDTCYIDGDLHKYSTNFNWNLPRDQFEKEGSDNLFHHFINQNSNNSVFESAPTLAVVQTWLREVKNIEVETTWYVPLEKGLQEDFQKRKYDYSIQTGVEYSSYGDAMNEFNTYDEALESGIEKALKLVIVHKHN